MPETGLRLTGRLVMGLAVIGLGVIFTLDQLGIVNAGDILRWWSLGLIAYGVGRLTGLWCRPNVGVGLLFTAGGLWILLRDLHVINYSLWEMWPIAMIVLGISLVTRATGRRRGESDELASKINAFALMSGTHRRVGARDFQGGEVTAVMGGHDIDLRGAQIPGGTATIDLFIMWGGVDFRVPEDWRVSCEALPLMGGVEDRSRPPAGEPKGHLVLKGLVLMGGVEIKN
jgi:hypothetical protein